MPKLWQSVALVGALLTPTCGWAQGFMQPEGKGRVITSVIYSHSDKGFDDDGDAVDIADYDQLQVYVLAEYGLTKDLTLLLTPSYRDVQVKGGDSTSGLGYTDVGARFRLASTDTFTLAAQGLVRIPGKKRRDNVAQIGATDAEYDLRMQGTKTFEIGGMSSFFILEGAYRLRDGQPPNEFKIDGTLGVRLAPRFQVLASSYNTISDGRGVGIFSNKFRYHNAYVSGVYDVTPQVSLQLGLQGTLAGRNALRERGLFGSAWFRF